MLPQKPDEVDVDDDDYDDGDYYFDDNDYDDVDQHAEMMTMIMMMVMILMVMIMVMDLRILLAQNILCTKRDKFCKPRVFQNDRHDMECLLSVYIIALPTILQNTLQG